MTTFTTTWVVTSNLFPEIAANLEPRAARVVAKIAHDMEAWMKAIVAVDTGTLKASIRAVRVSLMHWKVVVGAHYGIYVEWGTRYMRAQPFVQPTVNAARPVFLAAMRTVIAA